MRRRCALAESRRIERGLLRDLDDILFMVSKSLGERGGRCAPEEEERTGLPYRIHVTDFLRLGNGINSVEWRLVNATLRMGSVYVARSELIRLIAEKAELSIMRRLEKMRVTNVSASSRETVERIRGLLATILAKPLPSAEASKDETSWPPCMRALENVPFYGSKVGHFGNFASASFMLSSGYTVDVVVAFYSQRSDSYERIDRYHVEHIAGLKGSRTKYSVLSCWTMNAHWLSV